MNPEPWIKIALGVGGVVGGAVLGFLFGRFNKRLDHRVERKKLKNALYAELGANYQTLVMHSLDLHYYEAEARPMRQPDVKDWIRTEVYNDALKRPVLFRELKEAKVLDDFYFAITKAVVKPIAERREAIKHVFDWFVLNVDNGSISRRRMYVVTGPFGHVYKPRWRTWLSRTYAKLISRNLKRAPNESIGYMPPKTVIEHFEAIRTGLPSREIKRYTRG